MERIYPFTNENLTESLGSLYQLDGAEVLSVIGSGDQYFTSILNGAKNVELYDINNLAWFYFVLKFYAIQVLSYEEFWEFFVDCHDFERYRIFEKFNKFANYLPLEIRRYFIDLILRNDNISKIYVINSSFRGQLMYDANFNNGQYIPYMEKEAYYKLQSLLREQKLPKFYNMNLLQLPQEVRNTSYDILLTSNIFAWLHKEGITEQNVPNYKNFLFQFKCSEVQAHYMWDPCDSEQKIWEDNDFELTRIRTTHLSPCKYDVVASLRSKK